MSKLYESNEVGFHENSWYTTKITLFESIKEKLGILSYVNKFKATISK